MNKTAKIILIIVLAVGTFIFSVWFYSSYNRFMEAASQAADQDKVEQLTPTGKTIVAPSGYAKVMILGALTVAMALGLGVLGGHELSHFIAERTVKHLYDDIAVTHDKDYEVAEQEWANGHYLEAINLMREFLAQKPKQVHVAIRIAEIYEKDLNNPLAAALEYEEVLKHRLAPEQWGWTAIHLCNIYLSKLNQKDQAIALLLRIDAEHGQTAAAEKARKRLAAFAEEAVNSGELTGVAIPPIEEEESTPRPRKFEPKPPASDRET
jgi:flagellar basal body-associated protein FliL